MAEGDLTKPTAAATGLLISSGEVSSDEILEAWIERAAGDDLNAYLWRATGEQAQNGVEGSGSGSQAPSGGGAVCCGEELHAGRTSPDSGLA